MEGEGETQALELMAPFLPHAVVTELCSGRRWEDYRRRKLELLRVGWARAFRRQQRIAIEMQNRDTRFVNGIGQHKAIVDPLLHAMCRLKYGENCWNDPDFRRDTYKKTPEIRMPAPKPKFIQVNGFRDEDR